MGSIEKFKLGSLALAVSACFSTVAFAQTAPVKTASNVNVNQLEEVVVTAQRVESTVQKTPIAIQTISGDDVLKKGIQDTQNLSNLVPGLAISQTAAGASFYIRGVGTYNETPNADSGVAVSLDQMYFSRPYGPDMALYDLQRVEVLKGPQGTLYGRNATGGSINFISKKPILGVFGGNATAEFGNYSAVKLDGAINVPVSEDVAMRVAFQSNRHRGYLKDGYDDADTTAARLHLYWEPSDKTSLLLTGEYMHNGQKGPGSEPYENNDHFLNNDPWAGGGSAAARAFVISKSNPPGNSITSTKLASAQPYTGAPSAAYQYLADPRNCLPGCLPLAYYSPSVQPGPYQTESNGFTDITVKSFRADSETNFGFATLSVIPTYLLTNTNILFYNAAGTVHPVSKVDQKSLEVRLTSPQNQVLTWIVGAFYEKEHQDYKSFNGGAGSTLLSYFFNPDLETTSKAIFAQLNYKLMDTLTATVGARHTSENKNSKNQTSGSLVTGTYFSPFPVPGLVTPVPDFLAVPLVTEASSANTYRLGLDWQLTPRNLLYTSYSTGFHSGGFNGGTPPILRLCTPNPSHTGLQLAFVDFAGCNVDINYKPERLNAIAIGSKNRFLNNTVQLNVELYNWQYKDLQAATLGPTNEGASITTTLFTSNAGNSRIRGIDAEASWLITPDDLASLSVNYNQSKYGTFINYFLLASFPGANHVNNYTGKAFLNAPDTVMNFGYQHTFHLANGGKLMPSVDGKYSSKITYGYPSGPTLELSQKAYTKYNLNLGYSAPDGKWDANLFVRNVGNIATQTRGLTAGPSTNTAWVSVAAPRTFGVNLGAQF